ncbi:MAG: acyl-CoA/acyl-ACP dehydrogenase [Phenylobacterium sp.]|jgi:alkylation response protein AidB-like acyl-CoA dehydrogenase|uniref:acyl-CoA dehydrogenase family protein n=2 Tax=Phenylobacterium sp. TaxID=1871053 RepID=UPI0025F1CF82|nr:acyl-CoA dehydrogenase family protein [Phenylobacterium sp.]MCA3711231.1 acyl-CoA/acyl-ACP dehydrogenase [Phenylobacterium sp.]MCA3726385.1 acyl-CoA/acyl-ACP dehydrogenase [Phenylobacterium sp.]MCA3729313.1 acyl-CoA/acyl-ACP dehydrogenase [Phenylobacterium sp.]MCA3733546.1 acyl-CoA/acyl-ACP dehydrogenase [Phenylobacterium sp.]MCA3738300.1 acyl-CoA/acyl-ACP dehydrogenase [Phenylobacterium sp.]
MNAHSSIITDADERAFLDAIDKWIEKKVRPVAMELEHGDIWPADLVDDMAELGLFGAIIDPEYGGLGLSATTYSRIVMRIAEEWMSLTGIFNSHLMMATVVQRFGTRKQKDYWLPRFVTGEMRGGLGLTEPDAGTDLQAIRTVAARDGSDYVVTGTKTWISNAIMGHCCALLVKTDPEAQPRHKGMSMLIVSKIDPETKAPLPGVSNGKKLEKLGYKGIDSGEFIFDGYRCDAELSLVGGEEGKGFAMATGGLEIGRVNIAARSVGIAKRALRESVAYAQTRKTMGKPIAEHQAIQLKLGDMAARTRAAELLVEDAARAFDAGGRVDMEAGMAKYFASETAVDVATEAMRIHGGYGYSKEYVIERLYRDAPLMCIGEGTNEMQRIIIAKQLVARNKI